MYQSRSSISICRQATEPVEQFIEGEGADPTPPILEPTPPVSETASIEASYTMVNRLDTLSVHTRNNFELFKRMFDAIREISAAQNHLTELLVELLKKQDTTHNMLHEMANHKPAEKPANPLPELKKSFSSQLLKNKKKP